MTQATSDHPVSLHLLWLLTIIMWDDKGHIVSQFASTTFRTHGRCEQEGPKHVERLREDIVGGSITYKCEPISKQP